MRTTRGRVATRLAYEHLGFRPATDAADLFADGDSGD
jgi:hypothetical protein